MDLSGTVNNWNSPKPEHERSSFLKYGWMIYAALSVQILVVAFATQLDATFARALIVASYIALLPALLPNLKRSGIVFIFVGAFLNFLVIAANGGTMPVDSRAYDLELGHVQENANGYLPWSKGSLTSVHDARLWVLGDIFAAPYPLRVVYSVGDVFIFAGMLIYLFSLTGIFRFRYRRIHN